VQSVDPGYRADHLLMARIIRASDTSPTSEDFFPRLLDRVKGLPGVTDAATVQRSFFIDWNPDQVITTEEQSAGSGASASSDQLSSQGVSPGYFRVMNIPLLMGRLIEDGERNVAVINSEMARRYWPGKDPIGKRFKTGMPESKARWKTVVGLVANTRRQGKEIAPIPEYYWLGSGRAVDVVVRTQSNPLRLAAALRSEVRGIDKNAVVSRISTMEQRLDELLAPRRFETLLLSVFSAVAVILAAIGIYSATYYAVGQRVKEIGIRIALGARPASVVTMLLRQTARVALTGIALGLAVSFGLSRTLTSLLYEIAPADPIALTVVPAALIPVAVCAALIPASRATRIDPLVALRHE
jgi:putative ABC transport system permease protein